MPLQENDYQRVAIHEASHALIAVHRGFRVFCVMLDGPEDKPGAVWRESVTGHSVETDPDWARREVGVMVAGYLGEVEFYTNNCPRFLEGPGGDDAQWLYAAVFAVNDQQDIRLARQSGLDSSEWRRKLAGRLRRWKDYDKLIGEEKAAVAKTIHERRRQVETIAKQLLQSSHITGKSVYDATGVPWNGKIRKAEWIEFK